MTTRQDLIAAVGERYCRSERDEKRSILDEFIELTGYHRKHASRVLWREPQSCLLANRYAWCRRAAPNAFTTRQNRIDAGALIAWRASRATSCSSRAATQRRGKWAFNW